METGACAVYEQMDDDAIVLMAKQGNVLALEYILKKYKNFVKFRARSYFLMGADREDIIQEGMIGLYKAIRDFSGDRLSSFRVFAEMCVTRQIISAVKTATRQKHIPLNSYVSLSRPVYDEQSDKTLIDNVVEKRCVDPEELVISKESYNTIGVRINKALSKFELSILSLYLDGYSYQKMSDDLGCDVKAIDNALQRVKRKLDKQLVNV